MCRQGENARLRQHLLDLRRAARAAGCDLNATEALSAAAFPELEAALRGPPGAGVPSPVPGGGDPADDLGHPAEGTLTAGRGQAAAAGGGALGGAVGGAGGAAGASQGAAAGMAAGRGLIGGVGGAGEGALSAAAGGRSGGGLRGEAARNASDRGAAGGGGAAAAEPGALDGRVDHLAEHRHACARALDLTLTLTLKFTCHQPWLQRQWMAWTTWRSTGMRAHLPWGSPVTSHILRLRVRVFVDGVDHLLEHRHACAPALGFTCLELWLQGW